MSNVEKIPLTPVTAVEGSGGGSGPFFRDRNPSPPDASRYRLIIQEGPETGSFIYTTLDRLTGEIIRQVPREEVLKLLDRPERSGAVIDTAV